jgi:hypothetical protein
MRPAAGQRQARHHGQTPSQTRRAAAQAALMAALPHAAHAVACEAGMG